MCKHAIATALAYLDASGAEPVEGLRTPVRVYGAAETARALPRPPRRPSTPTFLPGARPHEPEPCGGAFLDLSDARMDELASMRRALPVPLIPTPPKRRWSPRWCRTTIRCSLTALAGRSSSAFAVDRSPTWSRDIDGMADAYVRGGTFSYGKKLHVCPFTWGL